MFGMRDESTMNRSRSSEETESMEEVATLSIKGNLGKLPDGRRIESFNVNVPSTLEEIISKLERQFDIELMRESMLVLVNGVEANALNGMNTVVEPGDGVVILPMFHGG